MVIQRYLDWRTRTARPPAKLSVRAARYGALATLIAALVMGIPFYDGYRDAIRDAGEMAARADALLSAGETSDAIGFDGDDEGWDALRRIGYEIGLGTSLSDDQMTALGLGCGREGCA